MEQPNWVNKEGSSIPAYLRKNKAEGVSSPDTFMPLGMKQTFVSTPSELDAKFLAARDVERSKADTEKAKSLLQSMETSTSSDDDRESRTSNTFEDTLKNKPLTYIQEPIPKSIFGSVARFNRYLENRVKRFFK